MQNIRWDRPWLRHLGIALAYAAIYSLLRTVWIPHWQLTAGFHLACLLLVPMRYWPALFVGQVAALGEIAYSCFGQLGLPWALTLPFTSMAITMPVVFLFRKYLPVIDADKRIVISSLLLCILTVTLLYTGAEIFEYALMQGVWPENQWSAAHVDYFGYLWFLGAGLGIYMIVPAALWFYTEGDLRLQNMWISILRSRVLLSAAAFLSPCLYVLAYTIEYSHLAWVRHLCQVAMLLTPLWFAVRYGWQGASLACMLANLAVVLSMPALYDPAVLQTQELMMISSTAWLLLGARVSTVRLRHASSH